MRRRDFVPALAAIAGGCRLDRRARLNVFNWSSYIDPKTLDKFTAETGIHIRYGVYESNEEMLAKVMTGNSGWDIVFPTHSRIIPMVRHGLVAPLDRTLLPHLDQLDAMFQRPVWDPEVRWSVPYMWNATGIAYNRKLTPPPDRWIALWSESVRGRMTMLDDPEDVIGACLLKLGLPFNTTRTEDLERARGEAIAAKRYLRAYINAEVRDQLVAGDVLAAQLWSTTASQAMNAKESESALAFAYPAEGFPIYCDNAVILAESRRREQAHRFIDFLLRPEIAAANATVGETATANAGGRSLLEPTVRDSVVLYATPEILKRAVWPVASPPEVQRLKDRLWTEIKAA
jgi:spermidine/putrescine transport system substrate-binding protein